MSKSIVYKSTTSPDISPREIDHFNRTRALAGECMVLLRNEGVLPLAAPAGTRIALYGEGGRNTVRGGTGSGMTITRWDYSVEKALEEAGLTVTTKDWLDRQDARRKQEFDDFMARMQKNGNEAGLSLMLMGGTPPAKETEPIRPQDIAASDTDTAVFVLVRNAGEGDDREDVPGDFRLMESEKEALRILGASYANVVLVLNVCGPVATDDFTAIPGIGAILYAGQQGSPGGLSIADVLTGKQVPSGKLASTWPKVYADCGSAPNFGLQMDNMDDVYYDEGIYVGYRWFNTFGIEPGFPFGFGLGYTTFAMACTDVWADAEQVRITVRVTNTGSVYPGKEVVQVYVSAPKGSLEKPYQELKAYAKTRLLQPGESEVLTLHFPTVSMASYSESQAAWRLDAGTYLVRVGSCSRNTHVAARLELDHVVTTWQLRNLFPDDEARPTISRLNAIPYGYPEEEKEIQSAPVIPLKASHFSTRFAVYPEPEELIDTHPDVCITAQDVLSCRYTLDELVAQLSIEEMADFTTGNAQGLAAFFGSASQFVIPGAAAQSTDICLENRDIREWCCSDGPAGLHVDPEFVVYADGSVQPVPQEGSGRPFDHTRDAEIVAHHYQHCTAFPTASTAAVSWNTDVFTEISTMYGLEMKEIGLPTALKPSMNIHRDPLGGRNFEYYSEDPVLSGTYAAADVLALQQYPGITSTVKHFAANNNDRNRMFSNAHVSERTLREIYLKNFEIAIRTSQPGCIMSSYNLINGKHAANNRDLLTYVCRCEWGYDGMIMTDWFMTEILFDVFSPVGAEKKLRYSNTVPHECTWAGNDIVMPGCPADRADIIAHVQDGRVAKADLQRCTKHVIQLILRSDLYEGARPYNEIVKPEPPLITVDRESVSFS